MAQSTPPESRPPVSDYHVAQAWRIFPRAEIRVVTLYILASALWIIGSDWLVEEAIHDLHEPASLQTFKGLNFVATSGLVLFLVLRRVHTRRRLAEILVEDSRQRYELVARASNDAIWDWDIVTGAFEWGDGVHRLLGEEVPRTSLDLELLLERVHPEDRDRIRLSLRELLVGNIAHWRNAYRLRRKDGSYAWVVGRGLVEYDDEGKPRRLAGGIQDVTHQRQAEEALRHSERQLRALSARLQSLREEERTYMAREIHDELGQMLTGIKFDLRWIEARLEEAEPGKGLSALVDRVVEANRLADETITAVQRIVSELRPSVLDNLGLISALQDEAKRFQEKTGLVCHCHLTEEPLGLGAEGETTLFRIFQETLTNVARHAEATEVHIQVGRDATGRVLTVRDDGRGITEEALTDPSSLGLLGMSERAALLGGRVRFESVTPRGTLVTVWWPVSAAPTEPES